MVNNTLEVNKIYQEEHTAFSIKLDIERLIEGMPTVQGIIKEEDMGRLP